MNNIGRRNSLVDYRELSDDEDEFGSDANTRNIEKANTLEEESQSHNTEELNRRKQYGRMVKNSRERNDWEVDHSRCLPKGSTLESNYFIYIILHPGIFRLIASVLSKFLHSEFNMKLKSGKPDKFGKATTKIISNFSFKRGGLDYELQVNLYPTTSALDVKLKGSPKVAATIFKDKDSVTAAAFFSLSVMTMFQ